MPRDEKDDTVLQFGSLKVKEKLGFVQFGCLKVKEKPEFVQFGCLKVKENPGLLTGDGKFIKGTLFRVIIKSSFSSFPYYISKYHQICN